jgi:hypothetical protein
LTTPSENQRQQLAAASETTAENPIPAVVAVVAAILAPTLTLRSDADFRRKGSVRGRNAAI